MPGIRLRINIASPCTRHKKSLLPERAAGCVFKKAALSPARENSSSLNKQLCFFGSPAVLCRNGGVGEYDAYTGTAPA
jgi:hypothetical protein